MDAGGAQVPAAEFGDLAIPGYQAARGRPPQSPPWDQPEILPVGARGAGGEGSFHDGIGNGPGMAGLGLAGSGPGLATAVPGHGGLGAGGPGVDGLGPSGLGPSGPGPARRPRARPGGRGGLGRARIREAPQADHKVEAEFGAAPVQMAPALRAAPRQPWYQVVTGSPAGRVNAQVVARTTGLPASQAQAQVQAQSQAQAQGRGRAQDLQAPGSARQAPAPLPARARLPFVAAHPAGHAPTADGRRHCGPLEKVLHRQWEEGETLPAQVITAINRLAELPRHLQQKLADGLTGIFVGPGGVPDLDDMGALKGVPLPSGRATWDACAGAYGDRKLVVGSRMSPTPDVVCHEVGHALDDLDSAHGKWQSDSPEFKAVYDQCKPHLVSDFHRQRGGLGRKEFFADAFAAVASGQRPALVDMLGGNTRSALWVMLYFNRRYGI